MSIDHEQIRKNAGFGYETQYTRLQRFGHFMGKVGICLLAIFIIIATYFLDRFRWGID